MMLTPAQLTRLAEDMPLLQFDIQADEQWARSALPHDYLAAYGLDFQAHFPGLRHAFGAVESGGFRIATHYWLPQNPRGTLVVIHGYYDHVGIFGHAIRFALEHDLAVVTFDLPGHGLSSGEQAAIDSFDQYGDVLRDILSRVRHLLPVPFFGFGQSTGGSVLLNYQWRFGDNADNVSLEKTVLCAPLILPCGWQLGRFAFYLARPFLRRLARGTSNSSHDPAFTRFIQSGDPLQSRYLSLKWVGAMALWHDSVRCARLLDKSILVIQGTGDKTVDWRYNLEQIRQKIPSAQIHLIPDAGHQLINESPEYRNQVLAEMERWLAP
ncbi:alpha/beta hydrolase [Cellvibrio polysaccharolyticus]|uniref:Alpha/beta hydrolase n=1 Tax=Cellvibrio polysaccharolyticus TaxID=2082724 RepID=A0A928UZM0_9GAMM|nr:alpha/beta hydrolase [Cellvibrio polysaccharolyticus]MBE8716131.1 alpha/beta hydrolase [Cellvibrio polysaccharolyticus]